MEVRSGLTPTLKYDLEKQTVQVRSSDEMTYAQAKRLMRDLEEVLKRTQPAPTPTAPDDLTLIDPPWILRKLFGWQNIIKKAR